LHYFCLLAQAIPTLPGGIWLNSYRMSGLSESQYIERPILLTVSGGRNLARFQFPLKSQGGEARYCDELAERPLPELCGDD